MALVHFTQFNNPQFNINTLNYTVPQSTLFTRNISVAIACYCPASGQGGSVYCEGAFSVYRGVGRSPNPDMSVPA